MIPCMEIGSVLIAFMGVAGFAIGYITRAVIAIQDRKLRK